MNRVKEIYGYRDMIFSLVRRELRGRYQKSELGMLWTFLNFARLLSTHLFLR